MSRSNNTEIINPAKRYYEWVGSKGCLKYFDKERGEKGEIVEVPLPFSFLVLDKLSTIKGYSDADQSGFWSNEIRDIKKEPFTVRTKKGIVSTSLYEHLAPVLNQGACYCQSVYIAVKGDQGLEICNFQIHGSAIGEWINLCKGKDIYKYAVSIVGATPAKKGATSYFIPQFKLSSNITPETEAEAVDLDRELQEYLASYFKRSSQQQKEQAIEVIEAGYEDYTDINTQLSTDASKARQAAQANHVEEVEVSDLPF